MRLLYADQLKWRFTHGDSNSEGKKADGPAEDRPGWQFGKRQDIEFAAAGLRPDSGAAPKPERFGSLGTYLRH